MTLNIEIDIIISNLVSMEGTILRKVVKSNPADLIRELLISKYGTLDNASKILGLKTRQSLNNNLRRWSKHEGALKAFYELVSKLECRLEYTAYPITSKNFDYVKFTELLENNKIKEASRLIDSEYLKEEATLGSEEYEKLRNQLENRREDSSYEFKILSSYTEKQLRFILGFKSGRYDFTRTLKYILDGFMEFMEIHEEISEIVENSEKSKEIIKDKLSMIKYDKPIKRSIEHLAERTMVDEEEIWVKLENGKIFDITNFFEEKSLLKFKVKKNREKLKIEAVVIIEKTDKVELVKCTYEDNHFSGKYNYITMELDKIKF